MSKDKTNVNGCARCGGDHEVVWQKFNSPPGEWTHYAICPTSQPILMRMVSDEEPDHTKDPEFAEFSKWWEAGGGGSCGMDGSWRAWKARSLRKRPSDLNHMIYCQRQDWRMEPDYYNGDKCNGTRPRWMTSYPKHGDEEEGELLEFKIPAKSVPPGTRLAVEVPCCPKCGDPADMNEKDKPGVLWPKCDCGFSWNSWSKGKYS